jgi:nucleotide-binding universal stress UspA family protein
MKNILVPLFGIESDAATLPLARLAALPFGGHLDCLHVRPGLRETIAATANVGAASLITQQLWDAFEDESRRQSANALTAFETFRKQFDIPVCDRPSAQTGVTAAFHEAAGERFEQIAVASRTRELAVLAIGGSALAPTPGQVGDILMRCGRPVLLAPQRAQPALATTVAIAWKDSAESARAVLAAMPFISKAEKAVILSVAEDEKSEDLLRGAEALANELRWHGVDPETKIVPYDTRGVTHAILHAAAASRADLLVMGAYGHSRLQEFVLGGATRAVLENAELPVFLFH